MCVSFELVIKTRPNDVPITSFSLFIVSSFDLHLSFLSLHSPIKQMNLLRLLALLGKNDQASSEGMYEVLVDVMKRADTGINIGYAIGECLLPNCCCFFSSLLQRSW